VRVTVAHAKTELFKIGDDFEFSEAEIDAILDDPQ
jgi:hypothetical protein